MTAKKSRWIKVGKLRIRISQSSRLYPPKAVDESVSVEDFDPIVMRDLKRIYPTNCHLCQDKMCPTADECDLCKMTEKPVRTLHVPVRLAPIEGGGS